MPIFRLLSLSYLVDHHDDASTTNKIIIIPSHSLNLKSVENRTGRDLLESSFGSIMTVNHHHPKCFMLAVLAVTLIVALCCRIITSTTQVLAFQPVATMPSRPRSTFTATTTTTLMAIPVLKEWRVMPNGRVEGKISNHPQWQDGSVISTSPLRNNPEEAAAAGKEVILVETLSGSQYLLINPIATTTPRQPPPQQPQVTAAFQTVEQQAGGNNVNNNNNNNSYSPTNVAAMAEPASMTTTTAMSTQNNDIATIGETAAVTSAPVSWGLGGTSDSSKKVQEDKKEGTMSQTKRLMQQVKDAGIAGVISYALWEFGFWTVSVPVCVVAYRQVTGHWPDFSNQEDLQKLGAEAFAFVNVARLAVPVRIGLALSTTPWIEKNFVQRFLSKKRTSNQ